MSCKIVSFRLDRPLWEALVAQAGHGSAHDLARTIVAEALSKPRVAPRFVCDGDGPHARGESRLLPVGGGGNAILCRSCFEREIAFRKEVNASIRNQSTRSRFELPAWSSLKVYGRP